MTARVATLGLALAALFSFEALAVTTLQAVRSAGEPDYLRPSWFMVAAPWLLIGTLYAIAAWRVADGSNAARWLSIVAAMLAAPLAVNVTSDIEPPAVSIFRPLACAIAPWARDRPSAEVSGEDRLRGGERRDRGRGSGASPSRS
jgi:hypothetical protein